MCSIVGLQGNVNAEDIVKMLKVSKNRGPDSSGVYLDKIYENINLDEFDYDGTCQIAFGHNLLSIYDSDTRMSKPQPVSNGNLVLVFNGELYNFNRFLFGQCPCMHSIFRISKAHTTHTNTANL